MSCYLKDEAERTIQLEDCIRSLEAELDAASKRAEAAETAIVTMKGCGTFPSKDHPVWKDLAAWEALRSKP